MGSEGIFAGNLGHQVSSLPHAAHTNGSEPSVFSSRVWFYHVQAQRDILKIIARDPAMDLAMKTLHGIIRRDVQERIQPHVRDDQNAVIPPSVIADYLAASLMVLLEWWFKQGMLYSPERMDEMFQQLVMPGVSSML